MNIPGFSTNGLTMLHDAIRKSLSADDNTPQGTAKPYGVREFTDWRELSDQIEAELKKRGGDFIPIPW